MSIQLDPTDNIVFERPLTRVVTQTLTIKNPNSKPVAFKVKTTAPKLYCVRPNSNIIPANESVTVEIMLQAAREEPALDAKCRDKFLILSSFLNERTETMSIQDAWAHIEEREKTGIHQYKLRCAYGQPNSVSEPSPAVQEVKKPVEQPAKVETQPDEEKLREMEKELNKYKDEVKTLRASDSTVVVEKVQVKQAGYPFSILIFLALLVAAIAYFIKF